MCELAGFLDADELTGDQPAPNFTVPTGGEPLTGMVRVGYTNLAYASPILRITGEWIDYSLRPSAVVSQA